MDNNEAIASTTHAEPADHIRDATKMVAAPPPNESTNLVSGENLKQEPGLVQGLEDKQ
jgi:hypothetical protein